VGLGVGAQQAAVGGDDLGGEQVVDGQAVLSDQVADPAAQGEPAEADRTGVAEPGGQAVGASRGGVLPGGEPRLGPGGVVVDVDVQGVHGRQVQHDPPFADAVPGAAVAAAADGELQHALAGQRDDAGDVAGVGGLDDDDRVAVDAADEHGAGLVVVGIPGAITRPLRVSRSFRIEMVEGEVERRTGTPCSWERKGSGQYPTLAGRAEAGRAGCRMVRPWRGACRRGGSVVV
jgi:hypothetical protein